MTEFREGQARIIAGAYLQFLAGPSSMAAIPPRDWAFPLATLRLIGAYTNAAGTSIERYYVFVAGEPVRMFRIPDASVGEDRGTTFFAAIEKGLQGHVVHGSSARPESSSHVMWPEPLARQPLFDRMPTLRHPLIAKLRSLLRVEDRSPLAASLQHAIGLAPKWDR
jgi:hypothetical protein